MFKQRKIEDVIKHPSEREIAYQEQAARETKANTFGRRVNPPATGKHKERW